jgi:hypothetical protein
MTAMDLGRHYLDDSLREFRKLKAHADKAVAQASDEAFFALLDDEANSIALVMKHLAGNMRSRWTDFLTSDGEKADRDRDSEFVAGPADTREAIVAAWEDGWQRVFDAVAPLSPDDLTRTVTIRGEPHTIIQAINRQLTHYAAHVGQIVLLAKHYAGSTWKSLSIPRGQSKQFNAAMGTGADRGPNPTADTARRQ